MDSALATPNAALRRTKQPPRLRGYEKVVLAYFIYLPCLGLIRQLGISVLLLSAAIPAVLWVLLQVQSRSAWRPVEIARDWWPLGLILVGYWAMGWFATPPRAALQIELVRIDRLLLYNAHLQALIEATGAFVPAILETVYLLLYAIPPACLGILYACGARSQVPRFLLLLFAGTFATYALLPYVPVIAPRLAFPGADLPHYDGLSGRFTIWLLDRFDISTSVLPSGHVAVALSSALGMFAALPRRPIFGWCALGLAVLVYLATIYCRYHYAIDGFMSVVIVCAVCGIASRTNRALDL